MRSLRIRISDNVLDKEDWPIIEIKFGYLRCSKELMIVNQSLIEPGVYGQDFLGWTVDQLAKWLSYDSTRDHPEIYHEVYSLKSGVWESGLSEFELTHLLLGEDNAK
jgi:hypothetical protein